MRNSSKHPRYQDYVIRDRKLVGEFGEMYRDFDDPWEQSSHEPAVLDLSQPNGKIEVVRHQELIFHKL